MSRARARHVADTYRVSVRRGLVPCVAYPVSHTLCYAPCVERRLPAWHVFYYPASRSLCITAVSPILQVLLKKGASIEIADPEGNRPLDLADPPLRYELLRVVGALNLGNEKAAAAQLQQGMGALEGSNTASNEIAIVDAD